jgi:hypothetical protein
VLGSPPGGLALFTGSILSRIASASKSQAGG